MKERIRLVDRDKKPSMRQQCEILGVNRSSLYVKPRGETEENLALMVLIDREYTRHPFYGIRRMREYLRDQSYNVNRKRVERLYRVMGIQGIGPRPKTTQSNPEHKIYPYLLRGLTVSRVNQVWATDITYIPMAKGFMYLMAIIDLHSRYVVGWSLSNTMDAIWCAETYREAIREHGKPEIINTDQGSQFTSDVFTKVSLDENIQISMDGKRRAVDNIFIERLWRSVKQEYVYLNPAADGLELWNGLDDYFRFYNQERYHQSLNYKKPVELFKNVV